ncbi:hypothetical protein PM3016_639 [Paenibacillus mucilaginosus 3016]|uniref:Uncharacterized protein n=1 Tax=Paenibacillus mucilaginosus 3016 TaxID=1116391 RepID=H6NTE1_9BACL|nr:hypothetical protein PM3016_639 [Paenibacillus mucilaginosus 3016]
MEKAVGARRRRRIRRMEKKPSCVQTKKDHQNGLGPGGTNGKEPLRPGRQESQDSFRPGPAGAGLLRESYGIKIPGSR